MSHSLISFSKKMSFILLFCTSSMVYISCTKTTTTTTTTTTPTVKPTTFTASVNSSPIINFTPSKNASGGNTSLIGTSTYYTITITFPSTTGTGSFFFNATGFSASIVNGSNTYVANSTYGSGSMRIDSISGGKYYGSFSFIGQTPSLTSMTVNPGNFSNL